jgi:kynurenine formamidase
MKIIDLSATIEQTPPDTPEYSAVNITYHGHDNGAATIENFLGVSKSLLRDGEGWSTETITRLETHGTTHVDAPWHYNSKIAGEKALTIDELPLEWFFGDGVRLDFHAKAEGDPITIADLESELGRIQYRLKPMDIVLMYTGRDKFYGQADYIFKGCGVTAEATRWLYDQGIRVVGIDGWGWDMPLNLQAEKALEKNEPGIFWSAHQADRAYSHMERLVNLESLPSHGFKVACFPLKIKGASGAPARVVAILTE